MQPVSISWRRWEWLTLLAILLLAAVLRWVAPGITEFKRDEANLSQLSLDLVQGRDFPLLGITSSVGLPNPPINVYLFAIPYAFDDSPILATLFVGLLNILAVGLTWALARRYYGPTAAVIAGLLYAVSPWAIIYSRKIWAQDLLPPFVVATVFTGLLGFGEGKRWARWLHWPLLVLAVQTHYGAFTLIPLSLFMLLLWGKRVYWRELAFAAGITLLTLLPVLIGFYRDDWFSRDTLDKALNANPDHEKQFGAEAIDYAWFTVAGTNIHSLAGPDQFQNYLDSVPNVYALFKVIPLAAVLSALVLLWRFRRKYDLVLVAWLALPVLAFLWQWTEVTPHYMIPLMPAAFILCGAGFAGGVTAIKTPRTRQIMGISAAALVIVISAFQILLYARLLNFLDDHATSGGFGTPLHHLLDIRQAVLDRDPQDVIVISTEELAPYDELPAVWSVLLDPVPNVRFVNGTQTLVIPADNALELIAQGTDSYLTCSIVDCQGEPFLLRPGSDQSYLLRPVPSAPDNITPIDPVQFANGASLTGYSRDETGIMLEWKLSGPAEADYQAFIHALDAQGQRLDQRDRSAWPGRYWRAGDTLYLWFDFPLPVDTTTLFVGMYTTNGVNFNNVRVLNPSPGNDLAVLGAFIVLPD